MRHCRSPLFCSVVCYLRYDKYISKKRRHDCPRFIFGYFHGEKAVEGKGILEFLCSQRGRIFYGQEKNVPLEQSEYQRHFLQQALPFVSHLVLAFLFVAKKKLILVAH